MKYILIIGLALLVLIDYAACCIAHDADERAERMYEEWRKKHDGSDSGHERRTD